MNENRGFQKPMLVIGQPVLDHVVDVDIVHQRGTLLNVMDIDAGQITFHHGSYISTEYGTGQRLVFGPFLDLEEDIELLGKGKAIGRQFQRGGKVPIPHEKVQILAWREDLEKLGTDKVGRLGYVARSPGGGATNCCYIINQTFSKLPIDLSGVYSIETDEIIEDCLRTIVRENHLQKLNPRMPINIVLEGITNDRIILKSPQPSHIKPEPPDLDADFMLVNTVYNVYFACAALKRAMEVPSGVVACTKSLLSEEPIPPEVRDDFKPYGISDQMNSVFSLFRNVILPESPHLTYIFNEDEFHHLLKHRYTGDERVYVLNGDKRILFDQLILGMRRFRRLQAPHKTNLIVTVGHLGAFWLDTDDDLHHCAVLTSDQTGKTEQQKNAIGDLFAGVLTALLYGYNGTKIEIFDSSGGATLIKESSVPPILIAASAAADVGIFDGFYSVRVANVNSNVHLKRNHYRFFGNLNQVETTKDLELLEDGLQPPRIAQLTKGRVKSSTVLENIVSRRLLQ